jgi:hypothetical protein
LQYRNPQRLRSSMMFLKPTKKLGFAKLKYIRPGAS